MKTLKLIPILAIAITLVISSCSKDELDGKSQMTVKMTDAPAAYDSVLVEVDHVEVHYADGDENDNASGWVSLQTNAGVYDLLQLRNGVTVVLADGEEIPAGKITQMRLVLGNGNRVVVAGVSFALSTPSAQSSGLKINVNTTMKSGKHYELVLDFDADASIVLQGNGSYLLKPVIKVNSVVEL